MHGADIHGHTERETARPAPDEIAYLGEPPEELPDLNHLRTRLIWVLTIILLLVILAFVPPLINVSRFQRRIASNLSAALGRPVHLDRVSLTLLPLPGFTLENFVVDEDPAFGYEPILRANQVHATVRFSSLWSHHVEFSRISLTEPTSLNLVRLADGRWNFEPVLLQASRIEAAPTAQTFSSSAPRFPYIEASGTRINLKLGNRKTPFALTDSEFSLWLPSPRQWRFRLEAHPARTDVPPSDAGLLRLEGALGGAGVQANTLGQVPIDLRVLWDTAPLAGLSRIAFGHDIGLRGDLTLDAHALGTLDTAKLNATVKLARARRADFVPARLVGLDVACQALAAHTFQSFTGIQCQWPASAAPPAVPGQPGLVAAGAVPDLRNTGSASASLTLTALPAPVLLDWIQAATPHPPTALTGPGVVSGSLAWNPAAHPAWSGELALTGELLNLPGAAHSPAELGDISLHSPATPVSSPRSRSRGKPDGILNPAGFDLGPISIPLGARQPATLEGHFDRSGYTLHLTGSALLSRLRALAAAFPQFGDGLNELLAPAPDADPAKPAGPEIPIHLDLSTTRQFGHGQVWTDNAGTLPR